MVMRVQKRTGEFENVSFDKIMNRISSLCNEPGLKELNIDFIFLIAVVPCISYDKKIPSKSLYMPIFNIANKCQNEASYHCYLHRLACIEN